MLFKIYQKIGPKTAHFPSKANFERRLLFLNIKDEGKFDPLVKSILSEGSFEKIEGYLLQLIDVLVFVIV